MVTYQPPDMLSVPIIDAIKLATVSTSCSAVQAARALGISFGDDYRELPFKFGGSCDTETIAHTNGNGVAKPAPVPVH
jgi:hypothetical protein